jgi:hypothetical protein
MSAEAHASCLRGAPNADWQDTMPQRIYQILEDGGEGGSLSKTVEILEFFAKPRSYQEFRLPALTAAGGLWWLFADFCGALSRRLTLDASIHERFTGSCPSKGAFTSPQTGR